MWLDVIVQPESSFSVVSVTLVLMLSGVRFAPPSCAESAIEKQAAWAAAINSSGFVPGPFSNRDVKEYCVSFSTPPGAEIDPFPSFSPPFHTALALRSIAFSYHDNEIKSLNIVERRSHICQKPLSYPVPRRALCL